MKYTLLLCLLLASLTMSHAQVVGKTFPDLEAETVDDEVVNLPKDVNGKYTLLGLAYSKKSEKDLNTWFNPIFNKFIKKSTGVFSGFSYDVTVYFVPMFTGVNAAATGTAKRKAAKNIDPQLLPYLLFYKGKLKPFKEALAFKKKDVPYFFVLDEEGQIVHATSGAFSDEKMDAIEEKLDE